MTRSVARDLTRQNIRYVEAFFSPPDYRRSKLDPQRATEALRRGLNRVTTIEVALVPDLVRDRGVEHANNLLERMGEVKKLGVIGIGIGGFEPVFPPELFEATLRARAGAWIADHGACRRGGGTRQRVGRGPGAAGRSDRSRHACD